MAALLEHVRMRFRRYHRPDWVARMAKELVRHCDLGDVPPETLLQKGATEDDRKRALLIARDWHRRRVELRKWQIAGILNGNDWNLPANDREKMAALLGLPFGSGQDLHKPATIPGRPREEV